MTNDVKYHFVSFSIISTSSFVTHLSNLLPVFSFSGLFVLLFGSIHSYYKCFSYTGLKMSLPSMWLIFSFSYIHLKKEQKDSIWTMPICNVVSFLSGLLMPACPPFPSTAGALPGAMQNPLTWSKTFPWIYRHHLVHYCPSFVSFVSLTNSSMGSRRFHYY